MGIIVKSVLGVAAAAVLSMGVANATPSFVNPNFLANTSGDPTGLGYYSFGGGADGFISSGNAGFTGQANNGFYDNGAYPNATGGVGFLQYANSVLTQTVGGFTIGDTYQISVSANARAQTGPVAMEVRVGNTNETIGAPGTVASGFIPPVDPMGTYATPFYTATSASFVALTTSETISFILTATTGVGGDGALLLSNAAITDLTPPVVPTPEPMSIALLSVGIAGIAIARKRKAS